MFSYLIKRVYHSTIEKKSLGKTSKYGSVPAYFNGGMLKNILQISLIFFHMAALHGITTFEEAMGDGYNPKEHRTSKRFQSLYELCNYEVVTPSEKPLIPKIIHQIWLGSPVPERFKAMMRSWQEKHPDWEYILWTEETLKSYKFQNKRAFDTAWNYGAKSDILRYELVEHFGGIYVDVDFECIRPLDPLVYAHSFFTSIGDYDYVNNAIFGAAPHHPILQKIVKIVSVIPDHELTGSPWDNTGPKFFTNQVCRYLKRRNDGIIYPIKFFHPMPNYLRHQYWRGELSSSFLRSLFIKETFAIHYWAGSWL